MKNKYRNNLPQLNGTVMITDGGLETHLTFQEGFELPYFAAFPLLDDRTGRAAVDRYMRRFANIATRHGRGFLMDTPTWRASRRWGRELGLAEEKLKNSHAISIAYLTALRDELERPGSPFVINGVIGPEDDGYNPARFMNAIQARNYHAQQVGWFADFGADMVSAITMTYADEAIGVAVAADAAGIDSAISFTVETDGRLPSGQPLGEAIEQVDEASDGAPAYYMINCAHPDHFTPALRAGGDWCQRIMGLRANASRMSHKELDNALELDEGNPQELGGQYHDLRDLLPNLTVVGGCCGTDHRHIEAISHACGHRLAA